MTTAPDAGTHDGPALSVDDEGIAEIRLGGAAREPFSIAYLHRFDAVLDALAQRLESGTAGGLVLRVGAPEAAATDLDLDEVRRLPDPEAARVWSREGQRVLERVERLPVPTVAAISGRCLGGGLQVALACSYRFAVAAPQTRLGLPETRLGALAAWGGTVRLPRLIGTRAALELMLRRDTVSARRAEAIGLVDDVFPAARFELRLLRFLRDRMRRGREAPFSRRSLASRVLEDTAPGRRLLFSRASRAVRRQALHPPPISDAVTRTVLDGLALPLDAAFSRESDTFAALLRDGTTRGLLYDHVLRHPQCSAPAVQGASRRVRRTAVVGAGFHGTLLAGLLVGRGFSVRLKDLRREAATRAVESVKTRIARDGEAGLIPEREAERRARRVTGTTGFGGFGRVDAVLEAVGETLPAKADVLREAERHVRDTCILLTTSPLIPLAEVQHGLTRPAQVAGLHLFMPDGASRLVEVARGPDTSEATLGAVCEMVRRLDRTPVVVAGAPGLVAYRLLVPYLNEALHARAEGVEAQVVDAALLEFGMPTGPLRLLARMGEAEHRRIARALAERLGPRFQPPDGSAGDAERPWRLAGPVGAVLRTLPGLRGGAGRLRSRPADAPGDLPLRLLLPVVNEAARALDEGVATSATEIDRVVTLAIGFAPERGGLLFHADELGAAAIVEALDALAQRHGPRFEPAPRLLRFLQSGGGFHAPEGAAAPRVAAAAGQPPAERLR